MESCTEESVYRINRALRVISECNQVLIRSANELNLLQEISRVIVDIGGYELAWVGFISQEGKKKLVPVAHAGNENGYLRNLNINWMDTGQDQCPAVTAIRLGKPIIARNNQINHSFSSWCAEAKKYGFESSISFPLIAEGAIIGALSIYSKESISLNLDSEEINLLQEMVDDLAYGIMALRAKNEQRQTEESLRKEKDKIQKYLDVAGIAVIAINTNQNVTLINKKGCEILGHRESDIIGKNWFDNFIPKKIRFESKAGFIMLMQGETEPIDYFESLVLTRNKEERTIGWYNTLLKDETDNIIGILCSGEDITERKNMEEELNKYREHLEDLVKERTDEIKKINQQLIHLTAEAKQASMAKSEFIANMSHELRTPLNSILGFTQILEAEYYGPMNSKQKEYAKDIYDAGHHLLSLINDILDLSKIEAGNMELNVAKVNLADMLNNAKVLLNERAIASSIKFQLMISPDIPEEISSDERKIKQVLYNLLSNAFKFTPAGGEVIISASKASENEIQISVEDNGLGIRKEDQKKLFLPFVQLDSSKPGTGLGLSLCKKMVNLWNGKIDLVSPPDGKAQGSRFYFTIPIKEKL